MRNADISPATDEDRRREFQEAGALALGTLQTRINISEITHRVRVAIEGDKARVGAVGAALAEALARKKGG